jgi:hypothetical protein
MNRTDVIGSEQFLEQNWEVVADRRKRDAQFPVTAFARHNECTPRNLSDQEVDLKSYDSNFCDNQTSKLTLHYCVFYIL